MKQTDGSSAETLATSLSFFDVNDHESHDGEREKKVVSPGMEELGENAVALASIHTGAKS